MQTFSLKLVSVCVHAYAACVFERLKSACTASLPCLKLTLVPGAGVARGRLKHPPRDHRPLPPLLLLLPSRPPPLPPSLSPPSCLFEGVLLPSPLLSNGAVLHNLFGLRFKWRSVTVQLSAFKRHSVTVQLIAFKRHSVTVQLAAFKRRQCVAQSPRPPHLATGRAEESRQHQPSQRHGRVLQPLTIRYVGKFTLFIFYLKLLSICFRISCIAILVHVLYFPI